MSIYCKEFTTLACAFNGFHLTIFTKFISIQATEKLKAYIFFGFLLFCIIALNLKLFPEMNCLDDTKIASVHSFDSWIMHFTALLALFYSMIQWYLNFWIKISCFLVGECSKICAKIILYANMCDLIFIQIQNCRENTLYIIFFHRCACVKIILPYTIH